MEPEQATLKKPRFSDLAEFRFLLDFLVGGPTLVVTLCMCLFVLANFEDDICRTSLMCVHL